MRRFIGAEFIGLARQFRQSVLQADRDYIANVNRITAPLQARLQRKPRLRPTQCIDTVRAWRIMPTAYRLALTADLDSKGALYITEYRLSGTEALNTQWQNPEPESGVAVCRISLTTANGLNITSTPHSVVSHHSIARWYERSGKRQDAALVRDVTALLTSGEQERVRCHSGEWLSSVIIAHGHGKAMRIRDVRTFIPIDDSFQLGSRFRLLNRVAALTQ